jgi:hypothetical protein
MTRPSSHPCSRLASAAAVVVVLACGEGPPADSARAAPPDTARASARLDSAARRIVGFLQGSLPFDSIAVADSVELRVSREGGGGTAVAHREELRDRARWAVRSERARYRFVPRAESTKLSTRVGRHLNCMEYDLATRAPDLASMPHVGTKLEPPNADSCIQTWNVTFVFDTTAGVPRLVAAVYDQFEW